MGWACTGGGFACGRVSFWAPRKKPKRRSGGTAGSDSSAFAPSSSTAAPLRTPGTRRGRHPAALALASGPPETTPRSPLMLAALPSLGTAFQPPPTGGLPRRGLVPAAGDGWPPPHPPQCAHWGTFPRGEGWREGQAPPLRKGRGKHRLPSCRSADGHQAPLLVGALAPSGRNAGRQHRGA